MNHYVMLGRFHQHNSNQTQRRPDRQALIKRILERTLHVPDTRINHVQLTLGRFDAVINAEAQSNNAAFNLATEIEEAAHMTVETMAVAYEDWNYPAPPPSDDEPAPVREPNPSGPEPGTEPAYAEPAQRPFNTVADALSAPEPGQREAPRRRTQPST